METWGKWTFGERGTPSALKGYFKCPNILVPISPQKLANEQWGKWALGKMEIWMKGVYPKCPKGVSQVPYAHYP